LYLGVRHERLRGSAYDDFVDAFVQAFRRRFPDALLQWEDFSKQRAFDLHDRYRDALPSFNDDVQGTGAVVLAGLLAAARLSGRPITDETIAIHGAGAGGVGVARQIKAGLMRAGLSDRDARARILVLDSRGLITQGRAGLDVYKAEVAQPAERLAGWSYDGDAPDLEATVREGGVTALIGLSGQAGAFGRKVVEAVDRNTPVPKIFPLSNPTRHAEALPEDVLAWTEGRALVATGSPFPDVVRGDVRTVIGQGNNAFVFPGVGLGAVLARARTVSDDMLSAAAEALAESVDAGRLEHGALFPRVANLREVSCQVAVAVIHQARIEGQATEDLPDDLDAFVERAMWTPSYLPLRRSAAD
ncbi:MAG: oxaloacetate-decarboxylating malate dehydrogenase, partial [Trueperaceae bacterium]